MMAEGDQPVKIEGPVWSRLIGVSALFATRAADVALTIPILMAIPAGEMNLIARLLGPWGYLAVNVVVMVAFIGLIEGSIVADRHIHGRRSRRRDATVRAAAYGWISILSLAVTVHNAGQLSGIL